jgi:NTP pyrophosphatase (non-canonical NTP hydrolase)
MGTWKDFSRRNRKRCEARDGFNHPLEAWTRSDWMTALVGEIGEAANVMKKLNRLRDGIPNKKGETVDQLHAMLRDELADSFTYLDLLAQSLGFDILEAAERKFEKVSDEIGYDPYPPFKTIGQVDPPVVPVKGDRWIDTGKEEEWEFDGVRWVQVPPRSRYTASPLKTIADDMAAGTATFGGAGSGPLSHVEPYKAGPATLAEYEGRGGDSGGAGATGSWVDATPASVSGSADSGHSSSDSGSSSSSDSGSSSSSDSGSSSSSTGTD